MATDQVLLAELHKFLSLRDVQQLTETNLLFILPAGSPAAYAVDSEGNVVGIKLAFETTAREPNRVLDTLSKFAHLKRLVFCSETVYDVPRELLQLKNLELLYFAGKINTLPPEILNVGIPLQTRDGQLLGWTETISPETRREVLEYESKQDPSPSATHELSPLRGIYLSVDSIVDPPLEIVTRGYEAIELYFRHLGADALPLNELKILLVGNGAAGKTSLVKCMLGDAFDPDEPQTHGIKIRSWSIRGADEKDVKLNFWDFGGQEIMHATHQFFLSKRSLYILVLDGRKDEDPEYWLQHIESFGGDSPVLVVLNKIDEHPAFDVNRRFLKNKYAGIIGFFRVSCANRVGVDQVVAQLNEALVSVPMLQTLWPKDWFSVKQHLENLGSAYVSLTEYRAICAKQNVRDQKDQEVLVDFLNDLGVMLHFKDIQLLDTHVLDPRWVTEAVYRIINSKIAADQKGFLRLDQLEAALQPPTAESVVYPAEKHRYIIDLMIKFELCYELDNSALLIPDLLDIQEPSLTFNYADALRFVFEYSYLPKSVMPRFIVRMHRDINSTMRWRTGVCLKDESFGANALVVADEKAKKIYAYVNGRQKRDYFSVIRKVITDINFSFEKLGVTERVPLPDAPDILLDYQELLGHELAGRPELFVGRLGRGYDVEKLLNGVEKKEVRLMHPNPIIVVEGDYFANSKVTVGDRFVNQQQTYHLGDNMSYAPRSWEKAIVYLTGLLFVGVISFLLIRNQPIADKNLVVFVRILLSVVIAAFGATIPGMLKVDFSTKGLSIRAAGALALFVITFILTPKVL